MLFNTRKAQVSPGSSHPRRCRSVFRMDYVDHSVKLIIVSFVSKAIIRYPCLCCVTTVSLDMNKNSISPMKTPNQCSAGGTRYMTLKVFKSLLKAIATPILGYIKNYIKSYRDISSHKRVTPVSPLIFTLRLSHGQARL
jgi:hypothetical protein